MNGTRCWMAAMMAIFGLVAIPAMALAEKPVSQDRPAAGFDRIEVNGAYDLFITQGKDFALRIEAESDDLEKIKTEVKDGWLVISDVRHKIQIGFFKSRTRKVYVTLPELKGLSINGAADVEGQNKLSPQKFELKVRGAGDVNLEIETNEISTEISGSGDIRLKGKTDDLEITVTGSGEIAAYELVSRKTTVNISGAGDCHVNAGEELSVNISGTGDVSYRGSPKLMTRNVAGVGRVRKE